MRDTKLNYDDITIVPDVVTDIESRKKDCNPYLEDGMLPIWAAPMDTVISLNNWKTFYDNRINVIIPRTVEFVDRIRDLTETVKRGKRAPFVAFSLDESKQLPYLTILEDFNDFVPEGRSLKVCIDMANGHMKSCIDTVKTLKDKFGDKMTVMAGNIANPKTYKLYDEAGCDYVRAGIGGGSACLTSSNVAVSYSYFSLMKEMYEIKREIGGKCKIIADGNIRGFGDIQKALIYADGVMIGGLFNKAIESAAKTTYGNFYFNVRGKKIFRPIKSLLFYGREVNPADFNRAIDLVKKNKLSVWKEFYGMSTKKAQKKILEAKGKEATNLKTSEGLMTYQKVEYSIAGWVRNETDYLRSAMSYTNSRTLEQYKNSEWIPITKQRYNS